MTVPARLPLALLLAALAAPAAPPAQGAEPPPAKKAASSPARKPEPETRLKPDTFTGLAFRGIGPAVASGRVSDIAIHPSDPSTWYVTVASGGVWKTVNAGTTWTPIFDSQGSYSIGCVTIDPKDPLVVWVGTGENNSQRSVAYGDGVYKSADGGRNWENAGLKGSEHIGKILVDPRDSDVIYVAAQGPLWAAGGERGLYKSTDGGKAWSRVLHVDEWTGVSDIAFDPRDPDVIYASSYQRHRRVWTLIDGGPGSGLHKSTDGGKTWRKLKTGLPSGDMGRIGIVVSPADPQTVYAIVEATGKETGVYRSTDAGGNWEKRSDYISTSPQYYQELVADPLVVNRVYSMDTWMQVTEDGGKTFRRVGEKNKHVDNHALWIDPRDTRHFVAGCDGGVYESFDRGATWDFKPNLPVTQFYKVAVDNALPFYNVYGGTQDNNTLGGPSRTLTDHGIVNSDWFVTVGGDGFQTQVDPEDPSIVYSQWQHGELIRFDRRSGEAIHIQPQPDAGEDPLRWNWDSPLIISPHAHTRLYFAAQRLFRSDDRGDSWRAVSPDLTRQIDRNKLEIMGRVWSVDAVAKNASTSFYGNIVSLAESPMQEGLIYLGTDDGLVQVTEDGGRSWRRIERFPGVPELSYVSRLEASRHRAGRVYAAFDNHKTADFKPYVLRSDDRGRSWTSIASDLPGRGTVYCLAEDHVNADLLFAGTEFGVYFTADGGRKWVRLKGGLPTIQVRDMAIQRRESDLVLATFGRGFYVLDDYSPLRGASLAALEREAALLPVKTAKMFVPWSPLGGSGKASQGDGFYTAPNPPAGAAFTYYLRDEIKTRKKRRQDAEKEVAKKGGDVYYPSWDSLRAEDREEEPAIVLTVTDQAGDVVRRLTGPVGAGYHRVAWDLRYPSSEPTSLEQRERDPWDPEPAGPMVAPGTYQVAMAKRVEGKLTPLGEPQSFTAEPLGNVTLPARDRAALVAFEKSTARLQRAVLGARRSLSEAQERVRHLKKALDDTPEAPAGLADEARALESRLADLSERLVGDPVKGRRNEPTPPSIQERVQGVVWGHWQSSSDATATHRRSYEIASRQFGEVLAALKQAVEGDLVRLERAADAAGAPWTPGRLPDWTPE